MTAVAIGSLGIALTYPQAHTQVYPEPTSTPQRASPSTPTASVSPVTITYTEPAPCNVSRPRRQTHIHVRPSKRPRPIRVRVKRHRRPLPSTLAELVHPARCEVVRHDRFYEPVGAVGPETPTLVAFQRPTVVAINIPSPTLIDVEQPYGGPSLFPDLGPIIAGGSGARRGPPAPPTGPGAVSAAPEPAEWALYTVGVGLIGLSLRLGRKLAANRSLERS